MPTGAIRRTGSTELPKYIKEALDRPIEVKEKDSISSSLALLLVASFRSWWITAFYISLIRFAFVFSHFLLFFRERENPIVYTDYSNNRISQTTAPSFSFSSALISFANFFFLLLSFFFFFAPSAYGNRRSTRKRPKIYKLFNTLYNLYTIYI